jgi:hypothetical protein
MWWNVMRVMRMALKGWVAYLSISVVHVRR